MVEEENVADRIMFWRTLSLCTTEFVVEETCNYKSLKCMFVFFEIH